MLAAAFIGGMGEARVVGRDVRANDFHIEAHRLVFQAVKALSERADLEDLDLVLLQSELKAQGTYERAGGARTLSEIHDRVGLCTNLPAYIAILQDLTARRDAIEVARLIEIRGLDDTVEVRDLLAESQRELRRVQESRPAFVDIPSASDLAMALCNRFTSTQASSRIEIVSGVMAVDLGFEGREASGKRIKKPGLGALMPGSVYVVQGKPEHGKSAWAINNYAYNCAKQGGRVYIWQRDMTDVQTFQRFIAADCGVPLHVQRGGAPYDDDRVPRPNGMSDEDWARVVVSLDRVSGWKIHIDSVSRTCEQAWDRMSAVAVEHGKIDLGVMDYAQLIHAPRGARMNKTEVLENACLQFKDWAAVDRLDCPWIVLSQPDKAARKEDAPTQTLADAKGSGALEEVAEAGFIVEKMPDGTRQIRMVKDRNYGLGGTVYGKSELRYNGARMSFEDPKWGGGW